MDRTSVIRLERVSKRYADGTTAVAELDLEVGDGEVCVLVGPSGCGKTTTLKMINRLVEPTGGRIWLEGRDVTGEDPVRLRRRIGYVIQNVGLFPHRTVRDNVATVPDLLGWDRRRARARADELLELVGLDPAVHGPRWPHQLSGGQRQRVGVARALAADPPVLLMDEPFGAVDPIARGRLQAEFQRLQQEVRKTVVIVTHDVDEAVLLADRIAVLRQGGVLEQYDTAARLLAAPASPFVADFLGGPDAVLRRLAVTPVDEAAYARVPVVDAEDTLDRAGTLVGTADGAVVVGAGGSPVGWLPAGGAVGSGRVGDRTRPLPGRVPVGASLQDALSVLLGAEEPRAAVVDAAGAYRGLVTPTSVHAALRARPR